jgi:hypothetical protein
MLEAMHTQGEEFEKARFLALPGHRDDQLRFPAERQGPLPRSQTMSRLNQ